jgi:hypothetical protein
MPLTTKDGKLLVKDGKLQTDCNCCGDWWCYDDAASGGTGACCRGNAVSVVVSLSGYLECAISGERLVLPDVTQTAVPNVPSEVPDADRWTHQVLVGNTVLNSTEGRSVRLRLNELNSTMEFTVLVSGILLAPSTGIQCGGQSHGGLFLALDRQATESYQCSKANALRRWDWIIGKSYSFSTIAGGLGVPVGRYPTFCKLDILGVVYS